MNQLAGENTIIDLFYLKDPMVTFEFQPTLPRSIITDCHQGGLKHARM